MSGANLRAKIRTHGFKIGHASDLEALTGCSVVLCEDGAVCGIDKRGGGTTTRQADAFEPWHVVQSVHGVLLTGGSAFGLGALSGVLAFLEEREIGFDMRVARVPIVAAAGLFDLAIGNGIIRPDPDMAYEACMNATTELPLEGCIGAGTGATAGKLLGMGHAMKSGIGWDSLELETGLILEALVAVNPGGDIINPADGAILAGVRSTVSGDEYQRTTYFADARKVLMQFTNPPQVEAGIENTVIGVVLTNAKLTKVQATKVAQMAHDGLARTIRPAHTMFDGDTVFTLARGEVEADVSVVGALAAEVFSDAIVSAALNAKGLGGLPAAIDVPTQ